MPPAAEPVRGPNSGRRDARLALQRHDSDTCERLLADERRYGDSVEAMQRVHRGNAGRLAALIAEHGWPGRTLVGTDGARAAWLSAQHIICTPGLQRGFRAQLAYAGDLARQRAAGAVRGTAPAAGPGPGVGAPHGLAVRPGVRMVSNARGKP